MSVTIKAATLKPKKEEQKLWKVDLMSSLKWL